MHLTNVCPQFTSKIKTWACICALLNIWAVIGVVGSEISLYSQSLEIVTTICVITTFAWDLLSCYWALKLFTLKSSFWAKIRQISFVELIVFALSGGLNLLRSWVCYYYPEPGNFIQVATFLINGGLVFAIFVIPAILALYLLKKLKSPQFPLQYPVVPVFPPRRNTVKEIYLFGSIFFTISPIICTLSGLLNPLYFMILLAIPFCVLVMPGILLVLNLGGKPDRTSIGLGFACFIALSTTLLPTFFLPQVCLDGDTQFINQFGMTGYLRDGESPFSIAKSLFGTISEGYIYQYDIVYFPNGSQSLKFDAYLPSNVPFGTSTSNTSLPMIIVLHGGSWQSEDKGSYNLRWLDGQLARQGYAVFDIQYSLWSPSEPWKDMAQMIADIGAFTTFLEGHTSEYHANLSSCTILGRSAGGQLALLAGLAHNSTYFSGNFSTILQVKGIVALYGFSDLTRPPVLVDFRPFVGDRLKEFSPITYVRAGGAPVLLFAGTHDPYLNPEDLPQFHHAMQLVNQRSVLVTMPLVEHAFDMYSFDAPHGQVTLMLISRFLRLVFHE